MSVILNSPETYARIYASLKAERQGLYQGRPESRDADLRQFVKDLEAINRSNFLDRYSHHVATAEGLPELNRPKLDDKMLDCARPHGGLIELYAELQDARQGMPVESRAGRTLRDVSDRTANSIVRQSDLYRAARERV